MIKTKNPWFITMIGSLFFFYAFFQTNLMASLNSALSRYFNATSSDISFLASWFFYSNIIFLIPAGIMLDRFSIKMLMGINMLIAVIGTILFAFADSFFMIGLGRFLSGIMMAFGLIICLKLATLWLPQNKIALATSYIVTIGMVGAIASQAPMIILIDKFGWQGSLLIASIFGLLIGIVLWLFVKDPRNDTKEIRHFSIKTSIVKTIKEKQNWLSGLFMALLNLPFPIFGALFGPIFISQVFNFSYVQSASVISMIFFGMIFGSPFFGWLSNLINSKKIPMLFGCIFSLIFMLFVLYLPIKSLFILHLLFFLLGFTSASQLLGYPIISESNPLEISGTALSLAALLIIAIGYGIALPVVAKILTSSFDGKIVDGIRIYSRLAYQKAFMIMPIGMIISVLLVFFIKEKKEKLEI